ncbi:MAG: YraN family protein [Actinomycetota bacterium]
MESTGPRAGLPAATAELGRAGEDAALDTYRRRGFELVARNWRCPLGELDLVLRRDRLLVFCEVKTRRGTALGPPYEAVHVAKQRKLRSLAKAFLSIRGCADSVRFDVASVIVRAGARPQVHLFEDAF